MDKSEIFAHFTKGMPKKHFYRFLKAVEGELEDIAKRGLSKPEEDFSFPMKDKILNEAKEYQSKRKSEILSKVESFKKNPEVCIPVLAEYYGNLLHRFFDIQKGGRITDIKIGVLCTYITVNMMSEDMLIIEAYHKNGVVEESEKRLSEEFKSKGFDIDSFDKFMTFQATSNNLEALKNYYCVPLHAENVEYKVINNIILEMSFMIPNDRLNYLEKVVPTYVETEDLNEEEADYCRTSMEELLESDIGQIIFKGSSIKKDISEEEYNFFAKKFATIEMILGFKKREVPTEEEELENMKEALIFSGKQYFLHFDSICKKNAKKCKKNLFMSPEFVLFTSGTVLVEFSCRGYFLSKAEKESAKEKYECESIGFELSIKNCDENLGKIYEAVKELYPSAQMSEVKASLTSYKSFSFYIHDFNDLLS